MDAVNRLPQRAIAMREAPIDVDVVHRIQQATSARTAILERGGIGCAALVSSNLERLQEELTQEFEQEGSDKR